jgi:galactosylceramidase
MKNIKLLFIMALGWQASWVRAAQPDVCPPNAVTDGCSAGSSPNDGVAIRLDARQTAATFEGIGALSAGASSRLLIDYPEPQRSQILDFLFKPKFGASLQHLKVEIGGDVDSTDGTEPSIARTREEFTHPKPEYFKRGYEWWLMKEAKKRNPRIVFDILQWGAPGWIGDGTFYSQDNADFIVAFIKGGKKYHDIDISYCGGWNEKPYDTEWLKVLRRTLNSNGLERVNIVAADEVNAWTIADKMAKDPVLRDAVQVIGSHYPGFTSTPTAHSFGKPVWSNEDGPWSGKWGALAHGGLAPEYNRNYVLGKMTKTIIWSPVTSYYDILPLPGSGMMMANQPYSGHYEVQPAIWQTAHTTQFIQPRWKYLAGDACALLPGGGSHVTAVSPDGKELSLVIETFGAKAAQHLAFKLAGLSCRQLHMWRSTAKEQFIRLDDVPVTNGAFSIDAEPEAIYSLTTTTGQRKGSTNIRPSQPFPLPYREDFEQYTPGATSKYLSDFFGAFEVTMRSGGGQCLKQVITQRGIAWCGDHDPVTIIGSAAWRDYDVSCDVCFDFKKTASIYGRIVNIPHGNQPPTGYSLRLSADGAWQLLAGAKQLLTGKLTISIDEWHRVGLRFNGAQLTVILDGKEAGTVTDTTYRHGLAGLGCGYEEVKFDNLSIDGAPTVPSLTPVKETSSSDWSEEYTADKAVDGYPETRWNAAPGQHTGWLEIDFGKPTQVARAVIDESFAARITKFTLEAQQADGTWKAIVTGTTIGPDKELKFSPVSARKFRLNIFESPPETPTINEFQLFSH